MKNIKKGINTIKLCVYFHTSSGGTRLDPKTAFKEGWVQMPTNHMHGIRASDVNPIYFGHSQGKLIDAIKECLKQNKIKFIEYEKVADIKKYLKMKQKQDFFDENLNV